jgi:hypothetical protein
MDWQHVFGLPLHYKISQFKTGINVFEIWVLEKMCLFQAEQHCTHEQALYIMQSHSRKQLNLINKTLCMIIQYIYIKESIVI